MTTTPAAPATEEQQQRIISLLNSPHVTYAEKQKVKDQLPTMTDEQATASIQYWRKTILWRIDNPHAACLAA